MDVFRIDSLRSLGEHRRNSVRGTPAYRFFVSKDFLRQFGVDLRRRSAVQAAEIILHFIGNHFIALARKHVHHRLRTHDLARRRDQGRPPEVLPDAGNFGERLLELRKGVLLRELRAEIGNHAAGDLVNEDLRIDAELKARVQIAPGKQFGEIAMYPEHRLAVEVGMVSGF